MSNTALIPTLSLESIEGPNASYIPALVEGGVSGDSRRGLNHHN